MQQAQIGSEVVWQQTNSTRAPPPSQPSHTPGSIPRPPTFPQRLPSVGLHWEEAQGTGQHPRASFPSLTPTAPAETEPRTRRHTQAITTSGYVSAYSRAPGQLRGTGDTRSLLAQSQPPWDLVMRLPGRRYRGIGTSGATVRIRPEQSMSCSHVYIWAAARSSELFVRSCRRRDYLPREPVLPPVRLMVTTNTLVHA